MDDIDIIFQTWEASINALHKNLEAFHSAELHYDSALAAAIGSQEKASTAEKMAKGDPLVMRYKKEMQEADRKVKAGKEKLKFLDAKYTWLKLKTRIENKIAES